MDCRICLKPLSEHRISGKDCLYQPTPEERTNAVLSRAGLTPMPDYLRASCAHAWGHRDELDADCAEAVKADRTFPKVRYYITSGHAGFNLPANNRLGYESEARARAAIRRLYRVKA